jgi:hypothetical protein
MKALIVPLTSLLPRAALAHSAAPHIHGSDWKTVAFAFAFICAGGGLRALASRKSEAHHDPR